MMVALAGQLAAAPIGGYVNPCVTSALRSSDPAWIGWPVGASDVGIVPAAQLVRAVAQAHPRALNGVDGRSYADDFYDRIHIRPALIALGNLVTAQTRDIEVWNAYRTTQTLDAVQAANADGITLDAPGALPLTFAPLQSRIWSVAVTTDGPPVIDATLQWLFAGPPPVQVGITGNRLTAWMVAPDWGDDLTETLVWLTDVQQAVDGSEVRQAARGAPRRQWEFPVIATGQERQIMESALYDWSSRTWALPVWVDATWLASPLAAGSGAIALDTTGHDYVAGGLAVLYSSATRYELVQVDEVAVGSLTLQHPTANAWPAGTRVLPCRTAQLTDYPKLSRQSDEQLSTQVRFQAAEECDYPAVAPATLYLGYPVLEQHTDEPEDLSVSYSRKVNRIDNDIGAITLDDPSGVTWHSLPYYWRVQGRADRATLRSLLYWLQGRGNALWVPSWNADLTLTATVAASASTISVAWTGYTIFLHERPGRRHVRIELRGGTVFYRRITDAVVLDADTEQLALDSALGQNVTPDQVLQISFMALARLSDDTVELSHQHDSAGVATCAVTFIGVPKEEP
jgi:hypothetical protein